MNHRTSSASTSKRETLRWLIPAVTLSALSLGGIVELFFGGAHRHHLLTIFLAFFFSGLVVLTNEFLHSRKALVGARLSHDRLRTAVVAGNSVVWDLDVRAAKHELFGDLKTVFGISSETFTCKREELYQRIHSEDRQKVAEAVAQAQKNHSPYTSEFRIVREDGIVRWVSATGEFQYGKKGEPTRMLGIAIDITERRQAEQSRDQSEEKFSKAFHQSPIAMTLTSTRDHRYIDVNHAFEQCSGWQRDEVIARTPFDLNIWVDTEEREKLVKNTLAGGLVRDLEVHFRRRNGDLGIGLSSTGLVQIAGEPCMLSAVVDITDRKRAEEEMATIGRRLIEAQEHERTWIGRELHDDINQRLALVSVELDRWIKNNPPKELREPIHHAQQRIMEIAKDVQSLSHRLHSSKLEYLGLERAATSFCKELCEQSNVQVTFRHEGVPGKLPEEISLSLFRVLQESLQNAVKHSGERSFTVELLGGTDSLELTVADTGAGFDPSESLASKGLGLISMRERLEMIHGEFSIRSKPGTGTTVYARVPLPKPASQALAG